MAAVERVRSWCETELSKITDCSHEITDYILYMETTEEVEEYLGGFLDRENEKQNEFMSDLIERLRELQGRPEPAGKWIRKGKEESVPVKSSRNSEKKKAVEQEKENKKKPTKYVSLYSKEGEARSSVRLPGRHPCECLGQKHALINNCINCGRIVCEQEGGGPCYFCNHLVCSKAEQEILARESKKSAKLLKQLMAQEFSDEVKAQAKTENSQNLKGLQKAIDHKNRLLEYDKTSVGRTKVIDDECDYFSTDSNRWLSAKERESLKKKEEELRAKRHASRKDMKITLDFAGRRVVEENVAFDMYGQDPELPVLASGYYSAQDAKMENLINDKAFPELCLKFISSGEKQPKSKSQKTSSNNSKVLRVQDRELQEMSDSGMCLSMHQPWASLLVLGIKRVEGRSWYTAHRGRLWIAATAKKPSTEDISEVEDMYKKLYQGESITFPRDYPTACLLGYVELVDCLSQEEYQEQCCNRDHTESSSPFVFICENPQQLVVKFPVKGQHKIWKLDPHMHKAGKQGLVSLQ